MYVEDLLLLSGGFQISANQDDIIVNRPQLDNLNERIVRKFNIKTDKDYLKNTSIIIWTTTPWTIPANKALAYNKDINYVILDINKNNAQYVVIYPQFIINSCG